MIKDWDKIADKEFSSMEADAQAQWADLRDLVAKRH